MPTILQIRRGRTFRGVKAASPAAMFGIVVDEHVVRNGQHMTVHVNCRRYNDLGRKESGWMIVIRLHVCSRLVMS